MSKVHSVSETTERPNREEWCTLRFFDDTSQAAAAIYVSRSFFQCVDRPASTASWSSRRDSLIYFYAFQPISRLREALLNPNCRISTMTKNPHQIRCSILPIVWTRAQFEQGDRNIIGYAKQLIKQNHLKGINVDRDDVAHNWWWLVDHVFAKGDTRREQFMSQVCRVLEPPSQQL